MNQVSLYDSTGRVITPDVRREIQMDSGYNPVPGRRSKPISILQSGSETWARNRDRLKSMADAREAAQYDWIGGVVARLVLYVVGRIHCRSTSSNPQFNIIQDEYFHGWCGDEVAADGTPRCDLSGRHRLVKMIQMAFWGFFVDGDHGMVEVDPYYSPNAEYCLVNIEADRIGSPLDSAVSESYIGGVTIDPETSRVVSYRTYRRTRTGQYVDMQDIAPDSFIHVFDPDRSDEYRGRTKLLRLLNDLRDIREWVEAEKIAGKIQSQYAAMIGTKDPFNNTGPGAWSDVNQNGTPTQAAEWGKILKMSEGENFSMLSPSARPSGAFLSFIQVLIRKMAVSLGLSYGFLWDLSSLGGVSSRIEVQSDLRRIQYWQKNLIVDRILNRVRQKVIAEGVALKRIPPNPEWKKCEWHFGPWISTDVGYEMEADISGVTAGFVPFSEIAGKYGRSPIEVFEANAQTANEALQVGADAALPVESFAAGIYPDITNQKAAFNTPTPQPPPPPLSIQNIGDKGVKQLIDILVSVKDGKMDRDAAIASLIKVFGISQREAEELVSEEPTPEEIAAKNPAPAAPGKMVTSKPKPKATK